MFSRVALRSAPSGARAFASAPGSFAIQTYNKISPVGLGSFNEQFYDVVSEPNTPDSHAIMLRSHKLQEEEVSESIRCIARCGAGTNNIPVERMTELGIPVFNTPGANANAVKELVLCGLFLASRGVHQGINHMKGLGSEGKARERVEKDKAMFGGQEIKGKTIGVIGLGHIGAATARDASSLGMKVIGFDPAISVQSALVLPANTELLGSMEAVFAQADYISLNIPYIKGEGGTHAIINAELLSNLKPGASILNFARGELVDSVAMKNYLSSEGAGSYVTDFPDDEVWDHPNAIVLPHLGASTEEAEDAAASMAARTISNFLETGQIVNSVNFPETKLEARADTALRLAIVNENKPGSLAEILSTINKFDLNILQQVNKSRGDVAYNVIDLEFDGFKQLAELQDNLIALDAVKSSRIIANSFGPGYSSQAATVDQLLSQELSHNPHSRYWVKRE